MSATLMSPDGRHFPLARNTLLGSGAGADIRVRAPKVSQVHALLRWSGGAWVVIDIQSTNGTRVDGALLEDGRPVKLAPGARLTFGPESGEWVLADASGPGLHAVRLTDGAALTATDGVLVLPNGDSEADVHQDADGRWCLDHDDFVLLEEGQVLPLAAPWRIHLPTNTETIRSMFQPSQCTLHLWPDGDCGARAVLETPGARHEFPVAAHWALPLALWRMQLRQEGLEHEVGWLDNALLARELGIKERSVPQYVTRVRTDLARCPVSLPGSVIEGRNNRKRLVGLRVRVYES